MRSLFIIFLSIYCQYICAGSITLLNDGLESLKFRFQAIESAKNEILINYYIVADDEISYAFFKKILDVKNKNPSLKVYMVFDGQGSKLNRSFVGYLKSKGIHIKIFHPFPYPLMDSVDEMKLSIKNINRRSHEKFMIIDNHILISGGRNLEKKYYDLSDRNFHDLDFFSISKKLASETRNYFLALWKSDYLLDYKTPVIEYSPTLIEEFNVKMSHALNLVIKKIHQVIDFTYKSIDNSPILISEEKISLLSIFHKNSNQFEPLILKKKIIALLNSKETKELKIISPYFLPDREITELLIKLRKKNVNVEIVTNSACSSDVKLISGAASTKKKTLLQHGVKIFEYIGPSHLHAKAILINDNITLIGSLNITSRSFRYNNEMMYLFEDEQIASQIKQRIKVDISNSRETKLINNNVESYCDKLAEEDAYFTLGKNISFIPFLYKLL